MSILDSRDQIKQLDKSNLLGSVEALSQQIVDALVQTKDLVIPPSYQDYHNVVVSGMGGSALGSHLIKQLFKAELKTPFEVVSHYDLPGYVNSDSLVLLSSYSGTTEETLESARQAESRGAKIMVITSGGNLAELARSKNYPLYLIKPDFNPCDQPRMAIGYALVGQLALFSRVGLLPDQTDHLRVIAKELESRLTNLGPESKDSYAKHLAFTTFDKHLIFVAAEHLIGAAHVTNNQTNENAKTLTSEWHLPELNHHYMEALSYPQFAKEHTTFIIFNSALYSPRLQKRVLLTKSLLEQKGYEVQVILAQSDSKLAQVFEIIQIGAYLAAYLPFLHGFDPSPIPNVDWFKAEMAK